MIAVKTDPIALANKLRSNGRGRIEASALTADSPDSICSTPEPFPSDALPPTVGRFVVQGAESRGVPPEFVAVPLLGFAGAVTGTGLTLRIKEGWNESPALWVGVVGDPGTGKSPGQSYAGVPIRGVQQILQEDWQREMSAYDDLPLAERRLKPAPRLRSVFTTDATIEAVADMLHRRNGLAIERDEIAGWTASFDAYKKGGDRQMFLSSWALAPWKVDRKTVGSIYIPRPVVCVVGGIQPERLPDLRGGVVDDGFPDRFLLSYPETRPVGYVDAEDDPETVRAVTMIFKRLFQRSSGTTVVHMTPQAHKLFRTFVDENAAALAGASGLARGWGSKAPTHLARIALVLHALSEDDPALSMSVATVDAAIQITEYFRAHFDRCLPLMAAAGTGRPAGDVPRVLRYLAEAAGTWVPRSDLMQRTRLSAPKLSAALATLQERGQAESRRVRTGAHEREDWRLWTESRSEDSGHSGDSGPNGGNSLNRLNPLNT